MTHPPFYCTAWNEAVADLAPAVQEMPVSVAALQREGGKKAGKEKDRRDKEEGKQ